MPTSDLLLIHPLLGKAGTWAGYLVEGGATGAPGEAIQLLTNSPRLNNFNPHHPWLIASELLGCADQNLNQKIVPLFPPESKPDQAAANAQHEEGFRQAKRKVALKVTARDKLPATGAWDHLLIGIGHARTLPPYALLGLATRTQIVALDIRTHGDHHWTQDNHCSLSTSEFLMTRTSAAGKADVTRLKLLEILSLIAADADTEALDAVFRQESKLSYSLLRLVNSAANAPRTPITCFSQAINLLGRRQLQRWIQLLVYADPNNGQQPNPLLQKAAARGRLMEILVSELGLLPEIEHQRDAAFMVGAFSLLDVLLNMSIGEVLQQLSLPEPVKVALARHQGRLGQLLELISAAELRDYDAATRAFAALPISAAIYVDAQLEALSWAEKINLPAESSA